MNINYIADLIQNLENSGEQQLVTTGKNNFEPTKTQMPNIEEILSQVCYKIHTSIEKNNRMIQPFKIDGEIAIITITPAVTNISSKYGLIVDNMEAIYGAKSDNVIEIEIDLGNGIHRGIKSCRNYI